MDDSIKLKDEEINKLNVIYIYVNNNFSNILLLYI